MKERIILINRTLYARQNRAIILNKILFTFLCSVGFCLSFAQNTSEQEYERRLYQGLKAAYFREQWRIAYQLSGEYLEQYKYSEARQEVGFYYAAAALVADIPEADRLGFAFLRDYEHSNLGQKLRIRLGEYFFRHEEYEKAIEILEEVNGTALSDAEQAKKLYLEGYGYLHTNDSLEALSKFKQVTYYSVDLRFKAGYYAGYILYRQQELENALKFLKIADQDSVLSVEPLIADSYYRLGEVEELLVYAEEKSERASKTSQSILYRLIGEVYFEKSDYPEAAVNFQKAIDLNKKSSGSIYYKLAYAYDRSGKSEDAIKNYKIAGLENSDLGQLSAFRLGELYLQQEELLFAAQAFEKVARQSYDSLLQEQAVFLSGKLKYGSGLFDESIDILTDFRHEYPQSTWHREATDLLAQAYLNTSNYERAIAYIEGLEVQSNETRRTYQRVSFLKAQQLFNDARFSKAAVFFEKALKYTPDLNLKAESHYWLAESYSLINKYILAQRHYFACQKVGSRVLKWRTLSFYGLAYIAYNQRNYQEAKGFFQNFLQESVAEDDYARDAAVRLADCYYVLKEFQEARDAYSNLLLQPGAKTDYLTYQLGLVHYNRGEVSKSDDYFMKVIDQYPTSSFADNALYQSGQMWFEQASFAKAANRFSRLISQYSQSSLVPYALLKRSLCYTNSNEYEAAYNDLTRILSVYSRHPVAGDALLGLQDLQKRDFEITDFDDLLARYKADNPESSNLESIDFERIKTKYFNADYAGVHVLAASFFEDYPGSNYRVDILYYSADASQRQGEHEEAVTGFKGVLDFGDSDYYHRSLDKVGKGLLQLSEFQEAASYYRILRTIARNPKETYRALEGLMKAQVELDLDSAYHYADEILTASWKPIDAESQALVVKLRIRFEQKKFAEAKDLALQLINESNEDLAAEALFTLASIHREEGRFGSSNKELFRLLNEYGSYSTWTDKAYLALIDNYISLDELLQAEASVESILSKSQDSIYRNEAQIRLEQINQLKDELLEASKESDTSTQKTSSK